MREPRSLKNGEAGTWRWVGRALSAEPKFRSWPDIVYPAHMPNHVRWREAGATYFFTVVTDRRRVLLGEPLARRLLRRALVTVRRRWPFDTCACVLLPDHLHCIRALPPGDDDFSSRGANVKRLFTKAWVKAGGREGRVAQVFTGCRKSRATVFLRQFEG